MNTPPHEETLSTGILHLMDTIHVGVWEWLPDTDDFIYTPRCEHLMGYSGHELPRRYHPARSVATHPDDLERVEKNFEHLFSGEAAYGEHEFRLRHKNGTYIWVQERFAVSRRDADGKPVCIAGILHDITKIKQAELNAEAERKNREYIARLAGLGSWEWDVTADHITFNDDYKPLLGFAPEDMNGPFSNLNRFMSESDLSRLEDGYKAYLKRNDDSVFSMEIRVNTASGHPIWLLNIASIVERDENGAPALLRGGVLNIDKTVRSEALLRDALKTIEQYNERLKSDVDSARRTIATMFDANPQINILIDDQFRAVDCNPAAIEFFGFSGEADLLAAFRRDAPAIPRTPVEARIHDIFFGEALDTTIKDGYCEFLAIFPGKPEMNAIMKRISYNTTFAVIIYVSEPSESEQRIQVMLDAAPIGCLMADADENFSIIECNQAILRLTGLSTKEEFLGHEKEMMPEMQPDGQSSAEKRIQMMEKAVRTGRTVFNWTYLSKTGELLPTKITLVRVAWHESYRLVCFIHDLRDVIAEQEKALEAEAYTQLMLDSTPLFCTVWDANGKIIDCNMETLRLFGLKRKADYINRFYDLNPVFQPDGTPSRQKADALVYKALETGFQRFEWVFRTDQGTLLPAEVMLVRVTWKKGHRILSYARDLREIKKANAEIERYTRVLRAINEVAGKLIASSPSNFNETIPDQLKHLGKVVGADRVSVWENYTVGHGVLCRRTYAWTEAATLASDALPDEILPYESVPALKNRVFSGEMLNVRTRDLSDNMRKWLADSSVKTVLIIPVRAEGHVWGMIRFDNCFNETVWPVLDKQALQYCGILIASAIVRNRAAGNLIETRNALMRSSNLLYAVNTVAVRLLAPPEPDYIPVMRGCLIMLARSADADRISLWRNFEDENGTLCSQRLASWMADAAANPLDEGESIIDYPSYLPEWDKGATERRAISLPVRYLNEAMRNLSVLVHTQSLLLAHIHIDGQFWGFISLSHNRKEHLFSLAEIDILQSAGLMIVMGLVRNEARQKLLAEVDTACVDPT
ncbi:PAS domain S-box protein [Desulfosarcina sp. OttesenSCG-928-B08]|nr:PAS domain S-box protein [Desulfosarcina sp. OttesenSCG-928-B08]